MKAKYLIIICSLVSLCLVSGLYLVSRLGAKDKNGFKRTFKSSGIQKLKEINIRYYSYYLAGLSSDRIYLGNLVAPLYMLSSDYALGDTMSIRIPVKTRMQANWDALNIQVDANAIYLSERTTSLLISNDLSFLKEVRHDLKELKFDFLKVLSDKSMLIRYYDFELSQKIFRKVSLDPVKVTGMNYLPVKQQEGSFSLDGCLAYNKSRGRLIHVYYYSNQFDCLDTNLNLLYRARTIDTNRTAKIKLQEINSKTMKETLLAAPPVYVNKRAYADGDWVYINSAVIADNETTAEFKNNAVIDVYALKDGKYHYSFYIPIDQDGRIHDFAVVNGMVIALYKQRLITYRLN